MKTICVISDTHGTLNAKTVGCICECDQIIHAGDIGDPYILTELKEIAPVTAVLGNNDHDGYPRGLNHQTLTITIENVIFVIAHTPRQLNRDLLGAVKYYEKRGIKIPKIVGIHGHTHEPRISSEIDAKPADFIVCPGSVTLPRNGFASFAKFVVDDGKIIKCEIRNLKDEVSFSL